MTRFIHSLALALVFLCASSVHALEGGYKDGLYVQSDDGLNSIKTNFHLQIQHQVLAAENQGNTNSFQIRRGRFSFSGNALIKGFTYLFQFEMASGRTNNVSEGVAVNGPSLLDAYVNYDFGNGIQVRAGQFKAPYNLEEFIADTKGQFIDRSIANDAFNFNRDIGIDIFGRVLDKKLEYHLFVMNEGTNNNVTNNNNEMLYGTRLVWNWLGDHGYTSSDLDHSESPQLMTGIAGTFNRVGAPTAADQSVISATADVAFRYLGFSFIGAGYYMHNYTAENNTFGFLGQSGYFLIPKKFEVMARFAGVIPSDGGVTNGYEAGGGLAYYIMGHKLKIVSDYALLINSPLVIGAGGVAGTAGIANIATTGGAPAFIQDQNDHRIRTQLQLVF